MGAAHVGDTLHIDDCRTTPFFGYEAKSLDAFPSPDAGAAPLPSAKHPRTAASDEEAVATPYLRREARVIALTRALRHLSTAALDDAAARAAAYDAAGLTACSLEEDAEALRRQCTYWRHVRPMAVAALEAFAGTRLDRVTIDQVQA